MPTDLATVKPHLNRTIYIANAKNFTLDIKDYYYCTPMTEEDHAQMPLTSIPTEIQCNLRCIYVNEQVYLEVRKGMPALKQSGIIAHNRLSKNLEQAVYECSQCVPSLWRHKSLPISFTLVVDDFGAQHIGKDAVLRLIDTLRKQYVMFIDWSGSNYLGFVLDWNYKERHVTL